MSTLKTNNIEHLDASSPSIQVDAAGGMVVAGVITATSMDLTSSDGFTVGTGASVSSPATNVLALGTNNAERVRIDSSGNVGIGLTNPQVKLEIRSSADAPTLTWNGSGQTIIGDTANQLAIGRVNSNPFGLYLQGRSSNSAARDILLNPVGGNVGIGTDNPAGKLEVYDGDGLSSLVIKTPAASDAELEFRNTNGGNATWSIGLDYDDSKKFKIAYASANGASLSANELIGISTGGNIELQSGAGIDFSTTSDATGMTSELLDDYEEGTFTPEFANSTGSTANISSQPATRVGAYTKIGDRVYFNLWISGNITTTETTNSIIIQGLPFDAVNGNPSYSAMSFWNFIGFSTYKDELIIRSQPNSDELVLQRYGTNLTFDDLTKTGISIMVSGHYLVA